MIMPKLLFSGEEAKEQLDRLQQAVLSAGPTEGLTHNFYKYPARFSPQFVRTAIETFSNPGDVVLDPFMGGGTTLVEAIALGRHSIGSDISPLACFITEVKTTFLNDNDYLTIFAWLEETLPKINLRREGKRDSEWLEDGYQRHLPWNIRKSIELIIIELENLPLLSQQKLARCALLSSAQKGLDCTRTFPSASEFRQVFSETITSLIQDLRDFCQAVSEKNYSEEIVRICLNVSATELYSELWTPAITKKPKLIVTSPPYPAVHVLYHRWQIKGRKETPTPFWIVNERDGNGGSFYTMGSRTPTGINNYFKTIEDSYTSLHNIIDDDAIVVQLIAFSDIETQLPLYLAAMERAGYQEVESNWDLSGQSDGRLWRQVPSRKWYATAKGATASSRELLLIHQRVS